MFLKTTVCITKITKFVLFLHYLGLNDADENRKVPNNKTKKRKKNFFIFQNIIYAFVSKFYIHYPGLFAIVVRDVFRTKYYNCLSWKTRY